MIASSSVLLSGPDSNHSWMEIRGSCQKRLNAAITHISAALIILDEAGADLAAARLSEALTLLDSPAASPKGSGPILKSLVPGLCLAFSISNFQN